jgi:hypothetical protein
MNDLYDIPGTKGTAPIHKASDMLIGHPVTAAALMPGISKPIKVSSAAESIMFSIGRNFLALAWVIDDVPD